MAKRFAVVCALFVAVSWAAAAGDVAQFLNLGFSPDSRYFMFGQYGVLEKNSAAWASSFIVDVPANAFAPKATRQFVSPKSIEPGANPIGALLECSFRQQRLPQAVPYRPPAHRQAPLYPGGRGAGG